MCDNLTEDCDGGGLLEPITNAINFATNPLQGIYEAVRDGAVGMATDWLPAVTEAALPDLTLDWWVQAYQASFAVAVVAIAFMVIFQLVRAARGNHSGREALRSAMTGVPLFMLGAMFGPAFGQLAIAFFGGLSDAIARWGVETTFENMSIQLGENLSAVDAGQLPGGVMVGILLAVLMFLGMLLVLAMMLVQLITLYFLGLLLPLALMFVANPNTRDKASKFIWAWIGILAMRPALIFFLVVAFGWAADAWSGGVNFIQNSVAGTATDSAPLQVGLNYLVASMAMFAAGLMPFVFMRFGKALQVDSGGGAGVGSTQGYRSILDYVDRNVSRAPSSRQATAQPAPTMPSGVSASNTAGTASVGATSTGSAANAAAPTAAGAGVASAGAGASGGAAAGGTAATGAFASSGATASGGAAAAAGTATAAGAATAGVGTVVIGAAKLGQGAGRVFDKAIDPDEQNFGGEKL